MATTYKNKPDSIRIAERETLSFEQLTQAAIEVFYPEAWALRQKFVARCVKKEENCAENLQPAFA